MPQNDKLRGMLGLAQRAGKLISGTDLTVAAVRSGKAVVALLDAGASENAEKKLSDACKSHGVPLMRLPEELLAESTGKDGRMMGALTDRGFAEKIILLIREE